MSSPQSGDLWPDDIAVSTDVPPVVLLRRQAVALGNKTKNLVEGEIRSDGTGGEFNHHFYIKAPALGNFRYHLFSAHHGAKFFPLRVTQGGRAENVVNSEEALTKQLRNIFASPEAREVVSALVAQSQAVP